MEVKLTGLSDELAVARRETSINELLTRKLSKIIKANV